jgi:hypothetical protein
MNEQELRALVRSTVARHLCELGGENPKVEAAEVRLRPQPVLLPLLLSQSLYAGLVNVGDACVIEPAVSCDHCGTRILTWPLRTWCQS